MRIEVKLPSNVQERWSPAAAEALVGQLIALDTPDSRTVCTITAARSDDDGLYLTVDPAPREDAR